MLAQVWIQPFYGFVEIQMFRAFPTWSFLQYELFAVKVSIPLSSGQPSRIPIPYQYTACFPMFKAALIAFCAASR